jgi:hypothetical protein
MKKLGEPKIQMDKYLNPMCGSPLWVGFVCIFLNQAAHIFVEILHSTHHSVKNLKNPSAIYSDNPDLTFCFQYSLLTWMPCFLLWFAAPLWVFKLTKSNPIRVNVSWLIVAKTVKVN